MRAALVALVPTVIIGCRAIAGIKDITYDPDAATSADAGCANATQLLLNSGILRRPQLGGDGYVYVEIEGSGLVRCKTTGCSAPEPVAFPSGSETFGGSTVGSTLAYFSVTGAGDGGAGGVIATIGRDGKTPARQTLLSALAHPYRMTIVGSDLYWTDDDQGGSPAAVMRCPLAGGCGQGQMVFSGFDTSTEIFADAHRVYVEADDASANGHLFACALGGTCGPSPTIVLNVDTSGSATNAYATDADYVYVSQDNKTDILRIDQSNVAKPIVSGQVGALGVMVDGKYVYWGSSSGTIQRAPKDGTGTPEIVVCGQNAPSRLAADATNLYWVTVDAKDNDVLMTAPKPP